MHSLPPCPGCMLMHMGVQHCCSWGHHLPHPRSVPRGGRAATMPAAPVRLGGVHPVALMGPPAALLCAPPRAGCTGWRPVLRAQATRGGGATRPAPPLPASCRLRCTCRLAVSKFFVVGVRGPSVCLVCCAIDLYTLSSTEGTCPATHACFCTQHPIVTVQKGAQRKGCLHVCNEECLTLHFAFALSLSLSCVCVWWWWSGGCRCRLGAPTVWYMSNFSTSSACHSSQQLPSK